MEYSINFTEDYFFVNDVKLVKEQKDPNVLKKIEIYHIGEEDYRIERSSKTDKAIVDEILLWCKEHKATTGEVLRQDDDCMEDAPYLICDIIDKYLKIEDRIVEDNVELLKNDEEV